jgi:hypothetical protein
MKKIIVYKEDKDPAIINQINIKREWMDQTEIKHAYHCMPISLANTLGWAISFPEEISFIWDGISDTSSNHVKIIKGDKYCSTARANATISFNTFLKFKTDEDITTLIMPVPNEFDENFQCFTTLISTSFYQSALPVAWRILKPNVEITIKENTPVAVFLPISLSNLNNFEVIIKKEQPLFNTELLENENFIKNINQDGKFSGLYRRAKNYNGERIGKHEVESIKLTTIKE